MNQIFDWLREQIEEKSVEVNNVAVVSLHNAIVSVNRAQLKWEQDCCEWKRPKGYNNCMAKHNCEVFFIEHYMVKQFNYCPFCGKPIKISEVE